MEFSTNYNLKMLGQSISTTKSKYLKIKCCRKIIELSNTNILKINNILNLKISNNIQ